MPQRIQTVTGPIEIDQLGTTLMHEHLVIGMAGWQADTIRPGPRRDEMVRICVDRVAQLKDRGVRSMLDPCPNDLGREYGPTPNDQRHRFTFAGSFSLPWELRIAPLLTLASAVPMDILMPGAQTRVPTMQRNAGGRQFKTPAELNAFLSAQNAAGGIDGVLLPLVDDSARFGDSFQSLDLRVSRSFALGGKAALEAMVECFNVWNATNVLGVSNRNYSGYANVLVRDSEDSASPGYLHSSSFGKPVTTAGGVFGSGGPRAFQLGMRVTF